MQLEATLTPTYLHSHACNLKVMTGMVRSVASAVTIHQRTYRWLHPSGNVRILVLIIQSLRNPRQTVQRNGRWSQHFLKNWSQQWWTLAQFKGSRQRPHLSREIPMKLQPSWMCPINKLSRVPTPYACRYRSHYFTHRYSTFWFIWTLLNYLAITSHWKITSVFCEFLLITKAENIKNGNGIFSMPLLNFRMLIFINKTSIFVTMP